ncbi:MAG: PrsW family intramembrane metalloprotease [Clostridiales bacterium]|nr:PrsW family intramembrane metalloprotease [Clostridiales bacterium]
MLFALALIPVVALLIFIYLKDKKEKEPIGLLIGLFFAGCGTVITALIIEGIGGVIMDAIIPNAFLKTVLMCIFIIGPAEEMGKWAVLRLITWKNKNFDYSYDAIVYSVFVSLGFAGVENIFYVVGNGWSTGLLRMFTAVPGHACFAVFMGFFYSKAKYASLSKDKKNYGTFTALSMIVPIIVHGLYDAIVMGGEATGVDFLTGISFLLWIVYVIAMFVVSFIIVNRSAKNDFCIVTLPVVDGPVVQAIYRPENAGTWKCSCGAENSRFFCTQCGLKRPLDTSWTCPKCGSLSAFNFCNNCGCPRPTEQKV